MNTYFRRAARRLLKSALRSVRNTFRYEAPAIGRFVARQLRPPQRAAPPKARAPHARPPAASTATPASGTGSRVANPAKAAQPRTRPNEAAMQRLVAEGMRLQAALQQTTSLADYQEISLQYGRVLAALNALSTPKKTAVKSHTRSGQRVRRHTRGA